MFTPSAHVFGVFECLQLPISLTQKTKPNHFLVSLAPEDLQGQKTMYPKVKVKPQEEDDLLTVKTKPPLEGLEYLSLHDFNSPVSEFEDESPTSIVRIPDSCVSYPASLSKGEANSRNKKKPVENTTSNMRAGSIPPPRAVLSSPDNDGLVRSRNKTKADMVSGLRDHNLCENRHTRCKVIPRRSSCEAPKKTKQEPKETGETKSDLKEKRRAGVVDTKQHGHTRKHKPDWI